MKKLFFSGLILISLTLSGCIIDSNTCVVCDIYDNYGHWVKDYGEYCGPYYKAEQYADDADDHARKFYKGWAECYFD